MRLLLSNANHDPRLRVMIHHHYNKNQKVIKHFDNENETKFVRRRKSIVLYSRVMVIGASHSQHDGLAVFGVYILLTLMSISIHLRNFLLICINNQYVCVISMTIDFFT
jgi:hypothetical protein